MIVSWERDSCVTPGGSPHFASTQTRLDHSPCATRLWMPAPSPAPSAAQLEMVRLEQKHADYDALEKLRQNLPEAPRRGKLEKQSLLSSA